MLRVEELRVEEDLEVDLLSLSLLLFEEVVAPVRLREEEVVAAEVLRLAEEGVAEEVLLRESVVLLRVGVVEVLPLRVPEVVVVLPPRVGVVEVLPLRVPEVVAVLPLRVGLEVEALPLRVEVEVLALRVELLEVGVAVEGVDVLGEEVMLRVEEELWARELPAEGLVAVEEPMVGAGTTGREEPGVQWPVGMGAGAEG